MSQAQISALCELEKALTKARSSEIHRRNKSIFTNPKSLHNTTQKALLCCWNELGLYEDICMLHQAGRLTAFARALGTYYCGILLS